MSNSSGYTLNELYDAIKYDNVDIVKAYLANIPNLNSSVLAFVDSLVAKTVYWRSHNVLELLLVTFHANPDNFVFFNRWYTIYKEDLRSLGLLKYNDPEYYYKINSISNEKKC